MLIGCIIILLSLPCFIGLRLDNLLLIVIGEFILIIGNEFVLGPSNAYMKRIFPTKARFRGISFGYCLGIGLAGGLTPLIESGLYGITHNLLWLYIWPSLIALITLILLCGKRRCVDG